MPGGQHQKWAGWGVYKSEEKTDNQYKEYGGYLSLYMQYTVFGQVFEGMDIVDKIAKVETHTTEDGQADKPVNDVEQITETSTDAQ